ncbi:MAG: ATP-binding cassette domain-containing protein [Candidatus Dadabacteria bacterium]|nr:ATP-binding cassette domain-containing protein [Candidatus Dadabacteria bacterium]
MSSEYIIELKDVWKKYSLKKLSHNNLRETITDYLFNSSQRNDALDENEFWALKNINLKIKKGESVGIYGPNGSGKTTIIKLLANVTTPTKGDVVVKGRVAPLISVSAGFHPDLSGRENILTNGTILGMTIKEIKEKEDDIIEFSGLDKKFLSMQVKKYSSGMNARLGFSIAVHSNADILLLDEVLAVGDENFQEKSSLKIEELKKSGKTLIIVLHNKKQLEDISDRIIYVNKGEIV